MVAFRRKRTFRRKSALRRLSKPKKSTAIMQLAKQVMAIKRSMKQEQQIVNYLQNGGSTGVALVGPASVLNLSVCSAWSTIFGSSADDNESPSAIWKSSGLDLHYRSYTEANQVNFTVFLVRCKDIMAPYINLTTGAVTLTDGTHFVQSAPSGTVAAGLTMLNKKFFDIITIKRFTIGQVNGTALGTVGTQTQFGTDRRFYMRIRPNTKLVNPNGNWKDVPAQDPSQTYLLISFNNNVGAIDAPHLFYNYVSTVQV